MINNKHKLQIPKSKESDMALYMACIDKTIKSVRGYSKKHDSDTINLSIYVAITSYNENLVKSGKS